MILSAFCRRTQNLRSLRACIVKAVQRSQSRELEGKRILTGKVILSIFPSDYFFSAPLRINKNRDVGRSSGFKVRCFSSHSRGHANLRSRPAHSLTHSPAHFPTFSSAPGQARRAVPLWLR